MQLVEEATHRLLLYVAELRRHGYNLTLQEFEEFARIQGLFARGMNPISIFFSRSVERILLGQALIIDPRVTSDPRVCRLAEQARDGRSTS